MDPYPQFEACSLDFQTDNLEALHSFQLALVPFKRDSNSFKCNQARTIFLRRRTASLEKIESGLPEKLSELKRLEKIRETIEAARGKRVDSCVGTEEKVYTREDVRRVMKPFQDENQRLKDELELLKRGSASAPTKWNVWTRGTEVGPSSSNQSNSSHTSIQGAAGVGSSNSAMGPSQLSNVDHAFGDPPFRRGFGPQLVGPPLYWNSERNALEPVTITNQPLQYQPPLPPPPAREPSIPDQPPSLPTPPSRSPTPDPSPPGPFFSLISHNSSVLISRELRSRLYTVFVRDLPAGITPLLLLQFLRRPQKQRVPRPVALAVTNAGNVMMAFTSEDSAEAAARCLDGKGLPGLSGQKKMQAESRPRDRYMFKWHQLSDEMRQAWESGERMPGGEYLSVSTSHSRGSTLSDEYEEERRKVLEWQRERAKEEREQQEADEQARIEEEDRVRQALYRSVMASFGYERDPDEVSDDYTHGWKRQRLC